MSMDRRYFLKLTGGSTLGLFAYGMLGGCETLLEQIRNRPTRRNIATLANSDPVVEPIGRESAP